MPTAVILVKAINNFGFTAFRNIINDGILNAVTAIINDETVPNAAHFINKLSAIGIVPKISA